MENGKDRVMRELAHTLEIKEALRERLSLGEDVPFHLYVDAMGGSHTDVTPSGDGNGKKTIADQLKRLHQTKADMREFLGLGEDVPFHKYIDHVK